MFELWESAYLSWLARRWEGMLFECSPLHPRHISLQMLLVATDGHFSGAAPDVGLIGLVPPASSGSSAVARSVSLPDRGFGCCGFLFGSWFGQPSNFFFTLLGVGWGFGSDGSLAPGWSRTRVICVQFSQTIRNASLVDQISAALKLAYNERSLG